jgi:DNA-directed RNA polymerase subunit RPC12/RpoP
MYLSGCYIEEIMEKFEISYGELTKILIERGIPLRCKNYNNNWLYCPNCRMRVFKSNAVCKFRKLRMYFCPHCGRRLRTKPRWKRHRGVKKQRRKRGKSALETEALLNGLRQEAEGKI